MTLDPQRLTLQALRAELQAGLRAQVVTTEEDLEAYAWDFSRLQRRLPVLAVRTHSADEVGHVFRTATRHNVPVVVRGAGHSSGGQILCDGGIVLENFQEHADLTLSPTTHLAEVSGRSRWHAVHEALVAAGRMFPVLTDHLGLSVGGTLSASGYGARSIAHGAQIDNVDSIDLVLPNGKTVTCSRSERADLFRAALGGQGRVGVIERAVLRTVPHRRLARTYAYDFDGIRALCASVGWLETWTGPWPDLFVGAQRLQPAPGFTVAQYGFNLEGSTPLDACMLTPLVERKTSWVRIVEDPEALAHARTVDLVDSYPDHARIWADYMFGYDGLLKFAAHVEQRCREPAARFLALIGLLIHRSPSDKVDFLLEPSASRLGRTKYMLGFYFFAPRQHAAEVQDFTGDLLHQCVALGGRPYLYGQAQLDSEQRRSLYGNLEETIDELLARHG